MNNLKVLRELNGLKQAAVAKELNVRNQASISEWETGRKGLSVENAIMFAEFYGVTVGCIVGTEPIPEDYPYGFNVSVPYSEIKSRREKAEEEGRVKTIRSPYTNDLISFIDERIKKQEDMLVNRVMDRLQSATSSSSEADQQITDQQAE